MSLQTEALIARLERFPPALRAAATVASADDTRWKPTPSDWSILEVCCHVLDEEREDFRPRLESTLTDPGAPWPGLDLAGIAERRGYNQRELGEILTSFEQERAVSVNRARSLRNAAWARAYIHPRLGPISAGSLLASWAAHDALHLRQIAKRLHQLAARDAGEHSIAYAGEW